ncbi:hypothetical protein MPSEU_000903200 [Mayamaea pseudoterrestris]|nr:hypothetical protein MPSEU_000903200 [Mayamaea pseudoterrestris]
MHPPIPLKPDELSAHLTCSICLNIPVDPVLTQCQHLFCNSCLPRAGNCPNCRAPNTRPTAMAAGSILYRIWSDVNVKCGNCDRNCQWTGSISDAKQHCRPVDDAEALKTEIVRLQAEHVNLMSEAIHWEDMYYKAVNQHMAANQELTTLRNSVLALRTQNDQLTQELAAINARLKGNEIVPGIFTGNYYFNRFSVVKLSQLISRYMDGPTNNLMDPNRIFNCVQACRDALVRRYSDNPVNYRLHMQMLFSTCLSSGWFSQNQWEKISSWKTEAGL